MSGDGEVLVLLNNDVYCRPDWLERLVAPLEAEPETGAPSRACSCSPASRLIDSVGLCADRALAGFPRLAGLSVARAADARPRLVGPAGATGPYRRTAWEEVGRPGRRRSSLTRRTSTWRCVCAAPAGEHPWCPRRWVCTLGSATHGHRTAWQRRHAGFVTRLPAAPLRHPAEPSGDAGAHHRGGGGFSATRSSRVTWRPCPDESPAGARRAASPAAARRPMRSIQRLGYATRWRCARRAMERRCAGCATTAQGDKLEIRTKKKQTTLAWYVGRPYVRIDLLHPCHVGVERILLAQPGACRLEPVRPSPERQRRIASAVAGDPASETTCTPARPARMS